MTKQEYEATIAELRERHEAFVRKVCVMPLMKRVYFRPARYIATNCLRLLTDATPNSARRGNERPWLYRGR